MTPSKNTNGGSAAAAETRQVDDFIEGVERKRLKDPNWNVKADRS